MWPDEVSAMVADGRQKEKDEHQKKVEERQRVAVKSQQALNDLRVGREKAIVMAVDELLSTCLGSADGYLPMGNGCPMTRRLQQALKEYGITPDYGAGHGLGLRR